MPQDSFAVFLRGIERRYPWLPARLQLRLAHAYGTRFERVLGNASSTADCGREILPQLYECELEYLCREEFAQTSQDILWRRSKLGLHLANTDISPLERWLESSAQRARPTTELS